MISDRPSRFPRSLKSAARILFSLLFWFLLWWGVSLLYAKPFLLPSPPKVLIRLTELLREARFYLYVANSLLHILIGLLAGCLIGFLSGIAVAFSRIADALLTPAFAIARATPVVCFVIVAWIFIGAQILPVFISALMVAPIILSATATSIRNIPPTLLEAAESYHLSRFLRFRVLYFPAMLPHLRSSLVTCVGLAWKSGVAAEVIALSANSVGYAIWEAKSWYMDYETVFAWTLVIVFISLAFETAVKHLLCHKRRTTNADGAH